MPDNPAPFSETPPPRTTGGNWRWEPPGPEELQKVMPGYTIEKLLGRGGMGAVYRGVQTNLDRPVAIKILPPGVEKEDPSFAERFKSEAKLMARLNHPAVVSVYDFGTTSAGQLYFAMEYVDGSDVSQMLAAQGRLPADHALAITAHVCDALSAAHELGIVHRDIKPANVLINQKGQVKVADFGLAKLEEPGQHGLTKTGFAMGTPDFVAPEALTLGTSIDGRADLYAVGVMLYQMLTGNIPRGAFKPASVLVAGVDPRYDKIIQKAMQHDREERHQSAAELRSELDVILTVPLVRQSAPEPAAVPAAEVAQTPGQRSAAQKPAAKAPQQRSPSAPQPAAAGRSKAPLFIGLAAAAAVGIGAFVMLGGKKPAAPGTAPAKATSAQSVTRLSPSTEPWQDMLRDPTRIKRIGAAVSTTEGLSFPKTGEVRLLQPNPLHDGAIRMLVSGSTIRLHARSATTSVYVLGLEDGKRLALTRWDNAAKKTTHLREFTLPKPVEPGQFYEMELRVVGSVLTAKFNGVEVATATDETYPEGGFAVHVPDTSTAPVLVKALEVLDLGKSKPAAVAATPVASPPPASPTPKLPPGQWVPLPMPDAATLKRAQASVSGNELTTLSTLHFQNLNLRDVALRGEFKRTPRAEKEPMSVTFRYWQTGAPSAVARARHFSLFPADLYRQISAPGNTFTPLEHTVHGQPISSDEWTSFEFAAVGAVSVARLAGKVVQPLARSAEAMDPGAIALFNAHIRNLEIINLDGLSEAKSYELLGIDEKGNDLRAGPSPVAAAPQAPDPGKWISAVSSGRFKPNGDAVVRDGIVDISSSGAYASTFDSRDAALRARLQVKTKTDYSGFSLRVSKGGGYGLNWQGDGTVTIKRSEVTEPERKYVTLKTFETRFAASDALREVVFSAVGNVLAVWIDGQFIGSVVDDQWKSGGLSCATKHATYHDIAFQSFDSPAIAASASPPSSLSKPPAGRYPPGEWVRVFADQTEVPSAFLNPNGEVTWTKGVFSGRYSGVLAPPGFGHTKNHAIRCVVQSSGVSFGQLRLRDTQVPLTPFYTFNANTAYEGKVMLTLEERQAGGTSIRTGLKGPPYKGPWNPQGGTMLEIAAVGEHVFARIGGNLALWRSGTHLGIGSPIITKLEGEIRDIEVINLDGLPEAEALRLLGVDEKGNDLRSTPALAASSSPSSPSSSPAFKAGEWVKALTKSEDLPQSIRSQPGVRLSEGKLEVDSSSTFLNIPLVPGSVRNSAMRAKISSFQFLFRFRDSDAEPEFYMFNATSIGISNRNASRGASVPPPFVTFDTAGATEQTWEFAVVGSKLLARRNGKIVGFATDEKLKAGLMLLSNFKGSIRDVEAVNLDGIPEAEALRILGVDEKGNDLRAAALAQEMQQAEQARAESVASAVPELKVLHDQFVKLVAERVTAPFDADVTKLINGYRSGIDREITNEKKAGHLDGVLALEAEKQLLADKQPVPLTDKEDTTPVLKKLRVIYREACAKIDAARVSNLKALTDPLSVRLKQMESTLTQQDRVADAKTVREYRENLNDTADAPPAKDQTAAKDQLTTEKAAAAPQERAAPRKFPRGDDRKAAEWVINLGGKVGVRDRESTRTVTVLGDLPPGKFDLTDVRLEFASDNSNRPKGPADDLLPLAGLQHLRILNFRYFPVTDEHLSILGSLPALEGLTVDNGDLTDAVFSHLVSAPTLVAVTLRTQPRLKGTQIGLLKSLKTLKNLSLQGCKLSEEGFAALAQLPHLEELQLPTTGITDAQLPLLRDFKQLRFLNLRFTTVSAAALVPMRNLGNLTRLGLEFTPGQMVQEATLLAKAMPKVVGWLFEKPKGGEYSAADIRGMAAFPQLASIECYDQRFDDAAAAGFIDLPDLKELLFDHSPLSDAALTTLAAHKSLSVLRLRNIAAITDKGLAPLASVKSLQTLEIVLCPGISEAGVASFKKQRPDITVIKR